MTSESDIDQRVAHLMALIPQLTHQLRSLEADCFAMDWESVRNSGERALALLAQIQDVSSL